MLVISTNKAINYVPCYMIWHKNTSLVKLLNFNRPPSPSPPSSNLLNIIKLIQYIYTIFLDNMLNKHACKLKYKTNKLFYLKLLKIFKFRFTVSLVTTNSRIYFHNLSAESETLIDSEL